MKLKRFLAVGMSVAMCAGVFTACNATTTNKPTDSEATKTTQGADEESKPEETQGVVGTDTTAEWPVMTAMEMAAKMGNGINLGNTMEAGNKGLGHDAAPSAYEGAWGQPVTTAEMIQGMKDAGFDTIRIPVAWSNTMHIVDGDYTISPDYLARVKEIVDYAYAADMYVIVNDHWDGGWWGMFGSATESTVEAAWNVYESMWTQIGSYFIDYDYHLIFESGNEELGSRLNDVDTQYTELTADSGTLSEEEFYDMANKINQKFVDTIRGLGANNAQRYLLIAGSGTDIAKTLDPKFAMPTDTAEDKLMLSVHFYDPSNYTGAAGDSSVSKWGLKTEVETMNDTLAKMAVYSEKGIPVVIGEYGVLYNQQPSSNDDLREGHITYIKNFLDNCNLYGYVPVLWDCNGVYNKATCAIDITSIANVYTAYSRENEKADYATLEELQEKSTKNIEKTVEEAPEYVVESGTAWIMYSASDWGVSSSVGDAHPAGASDGLISDEAIVTGPGTYTVGLDFTGTGAGAANSFAFAALAIYDGENIVPNSKIQLDEIKVNGEPIEFLKNYYTTCDNVKDEHPTTRVNFYNAWVVKYGETLGNIAPEGARCLEGEPADCTSCIVDDQDPTFASVETIYITFTILE